MKQLVDKMYRYIRLYGYFVRRSISAVLIYRLNGLLVGLAPVFWLGTMIVFLKVIYGSIKMVGGWSYTESLLLLGVHEILFSISWIFFNKNLRSLGDQVNRGTFDGMLLSPVKTWFTVSFCQISFEDIFSLISSLLLFIYALIQVQTAISLANLIGFVIIFTIGLTLCYLINLILATFNLFMIDASLFNEWLGEASEFSRYPADIYPTFLKTALTWFIPILFFAYIPTAFLLGKIGIEYLLYGVIITIIFAFIARRFWYSALKKYSSASG